MKQRDIFFFWIPLAFSWLLMTFEGPWVQAVIGRKPDAELQLAAFGLIVSVQVTLESPIIMLLATSSALNRDKQTYQVLWRFMLIINFVLTVIALFVAFTPLLDLWLGTLLGIPSHIVEATRPGMVIMILWSALIGYRRFYQGILIRNNHTSAIGRGTMLRVVFSGGVALLLGLLSDVPGAQIGAWSLVVAVAAEATYTHFAVQKDLNKLLQKEPKPDKPALTLLDVAKFHMPLAFTSLLTLLVRPVIESGLADTPEAERALAAWPVIFAILLVMRSGGLAWQEVVISLNRSQSHQDSLLRFTWMLGLGTSGLLVLLGFTPLIDVYIGNLLNVPESLHGMVRLGTRFGILLPFLTTIQSYLRALLMLTNTTSAIYQGMGVGFLLTGVVMWLGVGAGINGLAMASLALTAGVAVDLAFLLRAYTRNSSKIELSWQAAAAGD